MGHALGNRNVSFLHTGSRGRGDARNLTSILNEAFYTVQMTSGPSINQDNPPMAGVQLQFNIQLGESQHVSSSLHLRRTSALWITFRKSHRQLTSVGERQIEAMNENSRTITWYHSNSLSGGLPHFHWCAIMLSFMLLQQSINLLLCQEKYFQFCKVKEGQQLMRAREREGPPLLMVSQMLLDASTTF